MSLHISYLSFTPLSLRVVSQGILCTSALNSQKFAFLRFSVLILYSAHPESIESEFYQSMFTKVQGISSLDPSGKFFGIAGPVAHLLQTLWMGFLSPLLGSYPQCIPVVSWIACSLLCCFSSRCQGGWSHLARSGPSSMMLPVSCSWKNSSSSISPLLLGGL